MKEIYGTITMPVSMLVSDVREALMGVNSYNVNVNRLVVNGRVLKVHEVSVEWENCFED